MVTAAQSNVAQYDEVMTTKLAISYVLGLEVIHRARTASGVHTGAALDLACGPGHFSVSLAKHLGYDRVTGVDLSPGMLETAAKNAAQQKLADRMDFIHQDIRHLDGIQSESFSLSTFADAAHHMPTLEDVTSVLREMDRVTKASGLVVLMDIARLKNAPLTSDYVELLGADYVERGLGDFYEDFRNSMFAAWTTQELISAVPKTSRRVWWHLSPMALPSMQFVVGLPVGRSTLFERNGKLWKRSPPLPGALQLDWRMARSLLFPGRKVRVAGA